MAIAPLEDGLTVVTDIDDLAVIEEDADLAGHPRQQDVDFASLRDEFVDAFNARDLDALLDLVHKDVETPASGGDGALDFAEQVGVIWNRSPGALLTRAVLDGQPCAVAWLPGEDGCWCRVALVCFDAESGLLTVVDVPDDADALDRAEAEDPSGSEVEEWQDWTRWETGEETIIRLRR